MLRIVFAGTPEFALPALNALAVSAHTLVGVLTQPDRPAGRGRALHASPVKQRAIELGLPVAQPVRLHSEDERAMLRAWCPDVMVVVAYGLILPREVLELPRLGCLNIHASLLPRWRGAAPIHRAILAGDTISGVTIMQLDAGLDTGPLLAQLPVAIATDATTASLHEVLARTGAQLLLDTLRSIESGTAAPRTQGTEGVTYAAKLEKREALIDWTQPAQLVARHVRGCNPWPTAETMMRGERLKIWQAQAMSESQAMSEAQAVGQSPAVGHSPGAVLALIDGRLHVACGEGVLAIDRLQCAGRRVVTAADFAHSHALDGLKFL